MFLLGEFQNRIDPRGRAFVPVKFREQMGSPVYMVIDDKKCIECYNEEGIQAKYEDMLNKNSGVLDNDTVLDRLFANGDTQLLDTQGRIILKADYIAAIGAEKDIVFLGRNDHFEIWAKDEYDRMKNRSRELAKRARELKERRETVALRRLERETELDEEELFDEDEMM